MQFVFWFTTIHFLSGLIMQPQSTNGQFVQPEHSFAAADSNYHQLFPTIPRELYDSIFQVNSGFSSDGFDFPVGKPDAKDYYLSQRFGQKRHLGEDWNGKGGGNSDQGDPVYSIANGLVVFAAHVCCGWGNTIRLIHYTPDNPAQKYVESVYSHLDELQIETGAFIRRGQPIGTIGTADGKYVAHLHLELRSFIGMTLGRGYSDDLFGYLDPSEFILANRPE